MLEVIIALNLLLTPVGFLTCMARSHDGSKRGQAEIEGTVNTRESYRTVEGYVQRLEGMDSSCIIRCI